MSLTRLLRVSSATALLVTAIMVAPPANAAEPPSLTPDDDTWASGVVPVESLPSTRGDVVNSLTVDGKELPAEETLAESILSFGVGTNSIEGRYGSYWLVNGDAEQRIDLDEPEYVNEVVELEVPNEWLVEGENVLTLKVGTFQTSCGTNYDDYEIFDVELATGGPVTADADAPISYNMGDGSCGTNTTLLKEFDVHFDLGDDPRASVGLEATFDTTTVPDGEHVIAATTEQGARTEHTVRVNNGDAGAPQLNVADAQVLQGEVLVHDVVVESSSPAAHYELDGQRLEGQASGGAGTSEFLFTIGSNSSEARYGNAVLVNGQEIPLTDRDYKSEDVRIEFPNAYLQPGRNEIVMQTGTIDAGCGVNHDDFVLTNIGLDFTGGTATGVDLAASYNMGDGNCGSSPSKLLNATFLFDVAVDDPGVRLDIDTTKYPDGEHAISVVTADGARLTRHVVFDNNGPTLTGSTPAEGAHLSSAVELEVALEDLSGVDESSVMVTLDGAVVGRGDVIGAGLRQGSHELVIVARDLVGHESTSVVTFVSDDIPGGTVATQSTPTGEDIFELSATVREEGEAHYETTFLLGDVHTATAGTEGTSLQIPTELDPAAEGDVDLAVTGASDGEADRSPAAKNTSWQRFDVPVGRNVAKNAAIQWEGEVDPQRTAHLLAWDHSKGQWDELATQRGIAGDVTVLRGNAHDDHVRDRTVNVMVAATDPFADDIQKDVTDAFQDPSTYDFSIAHLTDTQYLVEGAAGDWRTNNQDLHPDAERELWYDAYADILRWVVDNAEERKIGYVAHTGDIIENNTRIQTNPAMQAQVEREWETASEIQKIIDDSGIPNGVLPGNHDNQVGTDGTGYNQHFGPERYERVSEQWRDDATYGGPWRPGDNQNHHDLFSAGGLDFVAVHLGYGVDAEEIAWANSVFQQYPDRNGILFTHAYLTTSTNPDGRDAPYSNAQGREQARRIVEQNPNVIMTLNGHHHGVGLNVRKDAGEIGNHVVEMLADYQFYEIPVTDPALEALRDNYSADTTLRFGSSFFRLLQFDVDRGELVINAYSPFFDEFGADEYDLEERYDATSDELRIPIQLTSRTTSLATDAIGVVTPSDRELGTASAAANEAATLTVDFGEVRGLPRTDDVTVAWLAVSRNESGGTVVSPYNQLVLDLTPEPAASRPATPGGPGSSSAAGRGSGR